MQVCADIAKYFILINREAGSAGGERTEKRSQERSKMGAFFGLYGV
jgi:hypothetical protein